MRLLNRILLAILGPRIVVTIGFVPLSPMPFKYLRSGFADLLAGPARYPPLLSSTFALRCSYFNGASCKLPRPQQQGGFRRLWRVPAGFFTRPSARFRRPCDGLAHAALRAWTRDVALWLIGIAVPRSVFLFFRNNVVPLARQFSAPPVGAVLAYPIAAQPSRTQNVLPKPIPHLPPNQREIHDSLRHSAERVYTPRRCCLRIRKHRSSFPGNLPSTRHLPTMSASASGPCASKLASALRRIHGATATS